MEEESFRSRAFGSGKINLIASVILMLILLTNAFVICLEYYPEFDGAMNFQVARNLIDGKGYTTTYQGVKGNIQTGPTLILPAAIFFKLMGISKLSSQLTNLVYFLLLLGILLLISRKYFAVPVSMVLLVTLTIPELFKFSLFGYGEAVAAVFTLTGIYLLPPVFQKKNGYAFLVGCIFGLAAVTKVLSLISIGTLLFLLVPLVKVFNKDIPWSKIAFRAFLIFCGLLAIPCLFEAYKLISFGSHQYLELNRILFSTIQTKQGFGGVQQSQSMISNFLNGARILQQEFSLPAFLIYLQLVALIALGMWRVMHESDPQKRLVICSLIIYYVLGMTWWHLFTAQQWWRRIFLFYLVLLPLLCAEVHRVAVQFASFIRSDRHKPQFEWIGFVVTSILLFFPMPVNCYSNVFYNIDAKVSAPNQVTSQIDTVLSALTKLPPNSIFLVDEWWQGPIISLFSGRSENFYDYKGHAKVFEAYREKKQVYFLLTYQGKKYDPQSYSHLFDALKEEIVFQTADYALVDLSPLRYYKVMAGVLPPNEICELIQEDINRANDSTTSEKWSTMVDFSRGDFQDQLCNTWYPLEQGEGGGYRWTGSSATVFLPMGKIHGPTHLILNLYPVVSSLPGKSQTLELLFNGSQIYQQLLTESQQAITITIPLADSLVLGQRVCRLSLQVAPPIPPTGQDQRELGIIVSKIGLE